MQRQLINLLPPTPRTLNITNGSQLVRDVRGLVSDFVQTSTLSVSSLANTFIDLPFRQPVYSDFLIHAFSLHGDEKLGTPLLKFTGTDPNSTIDVVFTPLSVFSLFQSITDDKNSCPHMRRMSLLFYDSENSLADLIPDIHQLIETKSIHKCLMPVGFLVDNMNSTFLNKVTSVVKGPVLAKKGQFLDSIKVKIPSEAFLNLDEWLQGHDGSDMPPTPSHATLYCVLVYLTTGPKIYFVKSVKSYCQVMNALRMYFTDYIIDSYDSMGVDQGVDISKISFGAIARLGLFGTLDEIKLSSFTYKTSNLQVIEIDNFLVESSTWDILI